MADTAQNSPNLASVNVDIRREYREIRNAINSLKERPEKRRGPYIISDEDLNDEFCINAS